MPPDPTETIYVLSMHASMITALSHGISFKELGLATKEGNVGYVQCLDLGTPYTKGGTVIFEIRREKIR